MSRPFPVTLSDWPSEDRKLGLSDGPLSALFACLDSVLSGKNSQGQQPPGDQKVQRQQRPFPRSLHNDSDPPLRVNGCF